MALDQAEVASRVSALAAGLIAAGVDPGDRVVLMGATAWEWALADLAILAAAGVTVPVYDSGPCRSARGSWPTPPHGSPSPGPAGRPSGSGRRGARAGRWCAWTPADWTSSPSEPLNAPLADAAEAS